MQAPPKPKQTMPRAIFSQPIRHSFQATKTVRFDICEMIEAHSSRLPTLFICARAASRQC
jgi:hypothetical protein